jgi:hypothetical protein
MDTTRKEKIAENVIAAVLSRRGLLVAKPVFDQRGADLLGFLHICGGAKFCRVQCKYRQAGSQIEIPIHYVPGAFVCVVYLVPREQIDNDTDTYALYCFFPDDIHQWNKRSDNYVLSLPSFETCGERFNGNLLDDGNFDLLRRLIQESTVQDEMGRLDFSNPNNSALMSILF